MFVKMGTESFKLKFGFNAMATIEEAMNMSVVELATNRSKIGFSTLRAFLYAGLSENYNFSIEECGNMLEEYIKKDRNNFQKIYSILINAMKESGMLDDPNNVGPDEKKNVNQKHGARQSRNYGK